MPICHSTWSEIQISKCHQGLSDIHGFNYAVIVETIVLKNKGMMFAVKHLTVTNFHALLWAFEVQYSDEDVCLVPFSSLHCHGTLSLENKRKIIYC